MVEVTDPRLGETVLDPACGTGGFLVEAYNHLEKQVKTVAGPQAPADAAISGCEPKSLPYLLCQMNLLLHGLDAPQIDPGNCLRFKLSEIGEKERVDVILTNPALRRRGGEGHPGQLSRRPADSRDRAAVPAAHHAQAETQADAAGRPARAAVVVPNGTLFGDGVCARIKEELLKEFNLHTDRALPNGVFAPYTDIPTNLLFFDRSRPDGSDLVLRASAARRPQEIHQDRSPFSSKNSCPSRLVEDSARRATTRGRLPLKNC